LYLEIAPVPRWWKASIFSRTQLKQL
jgi:hypothetical protein